LKLKSIAKVAQAERITKFFGKIQYVKERFVFYLPL